MRILSTYLFFWGLVVWVLILFTGVPGSAAEPALPRDTASVVDARGFSAKAMEAYRSAPAFQYDPSHTPASGLWYRIRYWIAWFLGEIFSAATGTVAGRIVSFLLVVGLMVYLATRMAGFRPGAPLEKGIRRGADDFLTEDDIHAVDFEAAITEAVESGNLRLAVRLWYLSTLQQLSGKGIIDWRPGKTNYAYLRELGATPYAAEFSRLTTDFEYCWYGDAPVEPARYGALQQRFALFNTQITES